MASLLRQTRVRLAIAYSGIFSLVALVAAVAVWLAIARIVYSGIDESLVAAAQPLQSAVESGADRPLGGGSTLGAAPASLGSSAIVALLFDREGNLLDRTGLTPAAADLASIAREAEASAAPRLTTATIDGVPQRVRANPVRLRGGQVEVLVLVRSRAEAGQLLSTTASVLGAGILVLLVAATVLGYGLAGTALRPVREISAEARAFSEHDLHRRITLDLPDDELGDLALTFNGMLARLETAFDSLGRFTADAAHELRAPLTIIRTEAEVALRRERSPQEYQASLATVLSEAERLGRIADQLLMLARAESGALETQMKDVDLAVLVDDAVRLWTPLAGERGITVIGGMAERGTVRGDPDLLRRLLDNLVDNALRHTPTGGEVRLGGKLVDRTWQLVVADSGPGVPDAARASIFERFSRADQARTREAGGAGLGLALCKAIAELHQGSISLDQAGGGGARFIVVLPVAPGAS